MTGVKPIPGNWEYRIVEAMTVVNANDIGRKGWELVGFAGVVGWFKRPI